MATEIRVEVYSEETDRLVAEETVPWSLLDDVLRILGLASLDEFRDVWPLNGDQRTELASVLSARGISSGIDYATGSGCSIFLVRVAVQEG